jgi:hypothetical protein
VRRLEVASFWAYLNKQHLYGRDFRRYAKLASVRTLKTAERFHVFEKARAGQSVPRSALLFLTLVAGVIAYELGRLRGIVSPS